MLQEVWMIVIIRRDKVGSIHEEHKSCVAGVPIFNHLEDWQMDEIMRAAHPIHLPRNETLYHAGDTSNTLYIVHKGRVRIYRLSENGREQTLRILGPGEFTGEYALFNETTHESYAVATEKTSICSIRQQDLQQFLQEYPTIALKVLQVFSRRLDETETQATSMATEKVDTRIGQYLIDTAKEREEFSLPMSRKELATYLGTTPETISRKLAEFEDKGYIKQLSLRKIRILEPEALI